MIVSSEMVISVAFEKLAITHSDLNANINISHFKPKILEGIDNLKSISYKRPDETQYLISLRGQLLLT